MWFIFMCYVFLELGMAWFPSANDDLQSKSAYTPIELASFKNGGMMYYTIPEKFTSKIGVPQKVIPIPYIPSSHYFSRQELNKSLQEIEKVFGSDETNSVDTAVSLIYIFKLRTFLRGVLPSEHEKLIVTSCSLDCLVRVLGNFVTASAGIATVLPILDLIIDILHINKDEDICALRGKLFQALSLISALEINGDVFFDRLKSIFSLFAVRVISTESEDLKSFLKQNSKQGNKCVSAAAALLLNELP